MKNKYTCLIHVEWKPIVSEEKDSKQEISEEDVLDFLKLLVPQYKNKWSNIILDTKFYKRKPIMLVEFESVQHTTTVLEAYTLHKKDKGKNVNFFFLFF